MPTVTISVPGPMKDWIEAQSKNGQFSGVSDYIRDLVRRDQRRQDPTAALIDALVEGEESGEAQSWTRADLQAEARRRAGLKHGG